MISSLRTCPVVWRFYWLPLVDFYDTPIELDTHNHYILPRDRSRTTSCIIITIQLGLRIRSMASKLLANYKILLRCSRGPSDLQTLSISAIKSLCLAKMSKCRRVIRFALHVHTHPDLVSTSAFTAQHCHDTRHSGTRLEPHRC